MAPSTAPLSILSILSDLNKINQTPTLLDPLIKASAPNTTESTVDVSIPETSEHAVKLSKLFLESSQKFLESEGVKDGEERINRVGRELEDISRGLE